MALKCRYSTLLIVFYFINMIVFSNGSVIAKVGKMIFAGMSLFYIIGVRKKKSNGWLQLELWLIGYTLYACLSYFWADSKVYALSGIKTILLNSFCVYILIQLLQSNENWKNIVLKSVAICPLFLFIRLFLQYGTIVFNGLRILGTGEHNSAGMYAAIGCFFSVYYILSNKCNNLKWYSIAALDFMIVLLSMSRKAMIYLLVPVILCYLFTGKNISQRIKNFIGLLILVLFVWFAVMNVPVLYRYIGSGLESVLNYFNGGAGDASAAGRNTRIVFGLATFKQKPCFGWGAMNYNKLFGDFQTGMDMVIADNNFIDILVNFGIVGFIVYYSIYARGVVNFVRLRYHDTLNEVMPFAFLMTLLVCDYGVSAYIYLYSQTFIAIATGMILENRKMQKKGRKNA